MKSPCRFHRGAATAFGARWSVGDVIGLACDLTSTPEATSTDSYLGSPGVASPVIGGGPGRGGSLLVSVNGSFAPPHGAAFDLPAGLAGLCPVLSAGSGAFRCNFGSGATPFRHAAPNSAFLPRADFPGPARAAPRGPPPSAVHTYLAPPASPAAPTALASTAPTELVSPAPPPTTPKAIFRF